MKARVPRMVSFIVVLLLVEVVLQGTTGSDAYSVNPKKLFKSAFSRRPRSSNNHGSSKGGEPSSTAGQVVVGGGNSGGGGRRSLPSPSPSPVFVASHMSVTPTLSMSLPRTTTKPENNRLASSDGRSATARSASVAPTTTEMTLDSAVSSTNTPYADNSIGSATAIISPLELPRHSVTSTTSNNERNIGAALFDTTKTIDVWSMDAELVLGRVAMIVALMLFATELTTGQSLPNQIQSLLSSTTSS